MAIPVYLQQFKAAGVYRVVFDKSTMVNESTETLRLVVGYSEVGPFNCPIYIRNAQDFVKIFGNISKKLEKRGIFFHRLALQMLQLHPIICLNLKKFNGETVNASTISTAFNPNFDPIDDVTINIEDIFDTTRFWTLSAEQLNELNSLEGVQLSNYINVAMTDTRANSASFFIRKASGSKVSQFNVTVNDWYSDKAEEKPEWLEDMGNNYISDFFAEIYVFKGKFKASQVLASETLKNYFVSTNEKDPENEGEYKLKLRDNLYNIHNEKLDTLDELYMDPTSNAIGHWVGCLIPYFKDKRGNYMSLDILFNTDQDEHKMMMSFNTDLLDDLGGKEIDLSGRLAIPTSDDLSTYNLYNGANKLKFKNPLSLETIYQGVAKTNLLGNKYAPVIADKIVFDSSINVTELAFDKLKSGKTNISGTLYVADIRRNGDGDKVNVILKQVQGKETDTVTIVCDPCRIDYVFKQIGLTGYEDLIEYDDNGTPSLTKDQERIDDAFFKLGGTWWYRATDTDAESSDSDSSDADSTETIFTIPQEDIPAQFSQDPYPSDTQVEEQKGVDDMVWYKYYGPKTIISSIRRLEDTDEVDVNGTKKYTDIDVNFVCSFKRVNISVNTVNTLDSVTTDSIYGSSVSFISKNSNWQFKSDFVINGGIYNALICNIECDNSLQLILKKGDCLLASDGAIDKNNDGIIDDYDVDMYYDNVYVQEEGTQYDADGKFICNYIVLSGEPLWEWYFDPTADETNVPNEDEEWSWNDESSEYNVDADAKFLIRVDNPLNQEIGEMCPHYLEGYTYKYDRPNGTDMYAKLEWQKFILSTLTDYKGLRRGLLNKADIDYRYIIDTFESFPQANLKAEFSKLAAEKQSAFCIANLPAIKTFVKCPYTSFTDNNGVFNPQYIVEGRNKQKPASEVFSLPTENDGASFVAFYTPLKFTDGYIDSIIPSAGLVSNLFMEKYMSRQPYYIVAGPNYGHITANGLVGPDYKFSREELYILEPYGFNCMIYRPSFGTFINANQTAKQTPLSALSRVNVRELVIYLQDEIEKVLQSYQWEFNNATTRNAILDKANQVCALIQANGGIQTYYNIMDESNNTPEIIDNEMAVLSTHIEPGFGCGKMVHELTLYRTGQMASAISEL